MFISIENFICANIVLCDVKMYLTIEFKCTYFFITWMQKSSTKYKEKIKFVVNVKVIFLEKLEKIDQKNLKVY